MNFDVQANLDAAKRSVSSLERDEKPARAVTLTRSYETTLDDLWDAVTNGERIPRWFLPITGVLGTGGRYQLEGNAGGTITACERLSHFALTWEFGGDVSWVDVHISEDGAGRARVTLTHTAHLSEHWAEYGPGATGVGWELGLMGLAVHITHPTEPKPDEEAFATSPDGKAFITGSSEGLGTSSARGRNGPLHRRCGGKTHDRVLHRRIGLARLMHGLRSSSRSL